MSSALNVLVEAAKMVEYDLDEESRSQHHGTRPEKHGTSSSRMKIDRCSKEEKIYAALIGGVIPGNGAKRRPGGAGTRHTHNVLEKNRRAHMKLCFDRLKQNLPTLSNKQKASNVSILTEAVKYIEELQHIDKKYEGERLKLRKCRLCLEERIKMLQQDIRKDLQSQLFAQVEYERSISPATVKTEPKVQNTDNTLITFPRLKPPEDGGGTVEESDKTATSILTGTLTGSPVCSVNFTKITSPQGFHATLMSKDYIAASLLLEQTVQSKAACLTAPGSSSQQSSHVDLDEEEDELKIVLDEDIDILS